MKTYKFILLSVSLSLFSILLKGQQSSLGDTLFSFNAGILTPTPDRGLRGIEFAEGHFWATGSDPDDLWQHKLYKFSADGTTLVDSWEYGLEFAAWGDLAYDGEYLWLTDVDTIRQVDMETGQKTGVWFKAPQYYNSGLAYDPASDHFWVSGDNNIISEVDRQGNVVNAVPFFPDLGAAGLAWDSWSQGGPYLWIWSMKYTPDDVRPKAFQLNPQTGTLTEVTFEGVNMNPQAPYAGDGAGGATITDQLFEGKVAFVGLHQSSYQTYNDQLDWVVAYDLDPEGTGLPGPEISVTPTSIQNNLMPGDSVDVPLFISNLNDQYTLNWFANLEYPGMWDTTGLMGDPLLTFDATALTAPDTNRRMRGIAYIGDYIYISTGRNFEDQFQLYKIKKDGSEIVQTSNFYAAFIGWTAITSDDQYIYGVDQYYIQQYNPSTGGIVATYPKTSFSADAVAYDPQQEHFYMGNSVGAIKVINKDNDEINFFVSPYEIEGLSWDDQTPGGPFLWAYHTENGIIKATRLNPNTGVSTGVEFEGTNLSINPDFTDSPLGIIVSSNWQENKLVMIALHNSFSESGQGADQVVVYDLATTPPPQWIELLNPSFGSVNPLDTDTLFVRLKALMEDTLMEAQIVINSNDVSNPATTIPVNFRMMPEILTALPSQANNDETVIRSVFPNPANSKVEINLYANDVGFIFRLFNTSGMMVKEGRIKANQKNLTMDVSNLPKGLYHLWLSSNQTSSHQKLLIQ